MNANYVFTFVAGTLTVQKADATVTFVQSPTGVALGANVPVTYTITVTNATANSTGTPTGSASITFANPGVTTYTPALVNGVATYNTSLAALGTYNITAGYPGDSNFNAATSVSSNLSVVQPGYSLSVSPSVLTFQSGVGQFVSVTVTPFGNFAGTLASIACVASNSTQSISITCGAATSGTTALATFDGSNTPQTFTVPVTVSVPTTSAGHLATAKLLWPPALLMGLLLFYRRRKLATVTRGLLMLLVLAVVGMQLSECVVSAPLVGAYDVTLTTTAVGKPGTVFANLPSAQLQQTAAFKVTVIQ